MKTHTFSIVVGDDRCNARCPFCIARMTASKVSDYVEFNEGHSSNDRLRSCIAGFVVDFEVNTSKKGEFARLIIENNYDFMSVIIWADQFNDLSELILDSKKCLILINGEVFYDNYMKSNMLQTNKDSSITLLR